MRFRPCNLWHHTSNPDKHIHVLGFNSRHISKHIYFRNHSFWTLAVCLYIAESFFFRAIDRLGALEMFIIIIINYKRATNHGLSAGKICIAVAVSDLYQLLYEEKGTPQSLFSCSGMIFGHWKKSRNILSSTRAWCSHGVSFKDIGHYW